MSTGSLAEAVTVPFFAAMLCIAPAITRPAVPVNLSLLLAALRNWQVYRLPRAGSALLVLPFAVGLIILATTALTAIIAAAGL